jgi:hypothetical protein
MGRAVAAVTTCLALGATAATASAGPPPVTYGGCVSAQAANAGFGLPVVFTSVRELTQSTKPPKSQGKGQSGQVQFACQVSRPPR